MGLVYIYIYTYNYLHENPQQSTIHVGKYTVRPHGWYVSMLLKPQVHRVPRPRVATREA